MGGKVGQESRAGKLGGKVGRESRVGKLGGKVDRESWAGKLGGKVGRKTATQRRRKRDGGRRAVGGSLAGRVRASCARARARAFGVRRARACESVFLRDGGG